MFMDRCLQGPAYTEDDKEKIRQGWEARLQLDFTFNNGKTLLSRRSHQGPLLVQRPFYPENDVCHVYLLHPPGGIVAGDSLDMKIAVAKGGHALLTTPAATKFYRSSGDLARQSVCLTVDEDAAMEWLPQETIVYEGARLSSEMIIELDVGARFIGWEIHSFGRPAAKEGFSFGAATLNWSVRRLGKPFFIERLRLDAEAFAAQWGLSGHSACATMMVYPASDQILETVRTIIANQANLGVTRIDGLMICRGLDAKADQLRQLLQKIWVAIRKQVTGREAEPPRIWAT